MNEDGSMDDNTMTEDNAMPDGLEPHSINDGGPSSSRTTYLRWALLLVSIIGLVASMGYIAVGPRDGAPLPAYATLVADDLHGGTTAFEEFAGDILIVDFWATWCAPCISEIPNYNALYADYKDRGVSMVGLTVQSGDAATVLEWMASDPRYQMDYPLVMSNDALTEAFGPIFGYPTTLLIDRDGTIVKRWIGAAPQKSEQLRELIDEILAGSDMSEQHEGHVH
ncbi:MAG: TlpA disulfide reductase family protein [Acidobacteriota bacterium]|jgi:thiol-disulfide isomerase/thioredoxin